MGQFTFDPVQDAFGETTFEVYLQEVGTDENWQSETVTYTLTILPVNDPPVIESQLEVFIDEDCGDEICDENNAYHIDLNDLVILDPIVVTIQYID